MAAKYDKIADRIDYTPSGATPAGTVVVLGGIVGVALEPIAAGQLGALAVNGQFEIDLATGATFTAGDVVRVTASEAALVGDFFGYAVENSGSGVVKALLVQSSPDET